MKIQEILSIRVPETEFQEQLNYYQNKITKYPSAFDKIGEDDGITFHLFAHKTAMLAMKENSVVAYIELNDLGDSFYETYNLFVEPKFRAGLAIKMYIMLLQKGMRLVSGDSQTSGGEAIWAKLFKQPKVKMYIYDPSVYNNYSEAVKQKPISSINAMRKAYDVDEDGDDGEKRLIAI